MALDITKANAIINDIVADLDRLYMVNDPTNAIALNDNIGTHTAKVLGTYKEPVWNSATNGNQITLDNDLTTNPLWFLIPSGSNITHWVFTDSIGNVVAIRTLTTAVSFSVDNAYYIRSFGLTFTNV